MMHKHIDSLFEVSLHKLQNCNAEQVKHASMAMPERLQRPLSGVCMNSRWEG